MTVLAQDPLIAAMAIRRVLPLHESSRRLRALFPECPRVYGVAVMGDVSRRRWWPLAEAVTTERLQTMFDVAAGETDSPTAVAQQLSATLAGRGGGEGTARLRAGRWPRRPGPSR
jgi:hypothetical protein